MSEIEREEFETIILAMSEEEKVLALKLFDSKLLLNELQSRLNDKENTINKVRLAVK